MQWELRGRIAALHIYIYIYIYIYPALLNLPSVAILHNLGFSESIV